MISDAVSVVLVIQGYRKMRTFKDFDDRYTAPIHGFKNAEDYWRRCSCRPFLEKILIPTLLVNARNDPFLAEACHPVEEARANPNLHLETPETGGHVGFISFDRDGESWSCEGGGALMAVASRAAASRAASNSFT